jgi:hypothetical protein
VAVSSNIFGGEAGPVPSEELVQTQALNVGLREAVMALSFRERVSPLTVLELVERLKNLGVRASRASVTAALAELALELELSGSSAVTPARTRDSNGSSSPNRNSWKAA